MLVAAQDRRAVGTFRQTTATFGISRILAVSALLATAFAGQTQAQDATTKWMRLWNGKNFTGWKYQTQYWTVADSGMIIAKGHLTGYNTFLYTAQTFSDFELSVRARLWEVNSWYTNSGIQYRSRVADSTKRIIQGPQADIGDGASASMYPEGGYGGPGAGSSAACRSAMKKSDWNHYIISANASKVSHKLNGATCNDFTNNTPAGVIGLQMHFLTGSFPATATTEVNFKDVFIRPLNNSFTIPDSLAVFLKADYTGGTVAVKAPVQGRDGMVLRRNQGRLSVTGLEAGSRLSLVDPLGRVIATGAVRSGAGREANSVDLRTGASGSRYLRVENASDTRRQATGSAIP